MEQNQEQESVATPQKNNKGSWITLGIVIAFSLVALPLILSGKKTAAPSPTPIPQQQVESAAVESGPVKEFTVDGSNFSFSPSTITVKKGDNVKITFKDDDGRHNLVLDGYGLSTSTIGAGSEDSISFVADKAGTFQYYCSVPTHKDKGMIGTLTVK